MNQDNHQAIWQTLQTLSKQTWNLNQLFIEQPNRGQVYHAKACGLYLDYSKQRLDNKVLQSLFALADVIQLKEKIIGLQQGEKVNLTENRPALHTALRLPKETNLVLDGTNIVQQVHNSLDKAEIIVDKIRQKIWRGFSGKAITDVVNIGVGGSDLGPVMAVTALDEWSDTNIRVHFISNMDGSQLERLLKKLSPETTLFIVSSKSFSTSDTFSNANTAIAWLKTVCDKKEVILQHHFIGVSASPEKMQAWGLPQSNQLQFWQWVGGRFSMWSVIGLAIAIKIGMKNFRQLLAGANAMDKHFATADFPQNLPVLLGLIGVWNSTFLNIHAHTILPYDGRLKYFPNYLMQLEMESNGKSVNMAGEMLNYHTAPVMWGDVGSNAQHAFYQLLHQGTQQVACDFIAPICRRSKATYLHQNLQTQHQLVLANCLAQSRVLAFGNASLTNQPPLTELQSTEIQPKKNQSKNTPLSYHHKHKIYRGNQPSSTILLNELTPFSLGALTALYEHKVFVMASIWQINPFDQWGVEMGKVMANQLLDVIHGQTPAHFDSSTNELLQMILHKE